MLTVEIECVDFMIVESLYISESPHDCIDLHEIQSPEDMLPIPMTLSMGQSVWVR